MGKKDSKLTNASSAAAEGLQQKISSLGDITLRKMFGGHGVFEQDKMFALVDSGGGIYFKADDSNLDAYEQAGSTKHARMPYYSVPKDVLENAALLLEWAQSSIAVSKK